MKLIGNEELIPTCALPPPCDYMELPIDGHKVPGAKKLGEQTQQEKRGRGRPRKQVQQDTSQEESQFSVDNLPASVLEEKSTLADSMTEIESSRLEAEERPEQATVHFDVREPSRGVGQFDKEEFTQAVEVAKADAYELLGYNSMEPTLRPPILPKPKEADPLLTWASTDCTRSSMLLRKARPTKTLQAAFFDRLEGLRRIVLAEIAKAPGNQLAMAAVGIAFDRECLILGAEEGLGVNKAREKVLTTSPGSFLDLATEIEQLRRSSKRSWGHGSSKRVEGAAKKGSKVSSPYSTPDPFRSGGIQEVCVLGCQGSNSISSSPSNSWRWCCGQHNCPLETVESAWSTKTCGAMVAWGSPLNLVKTSTAIEDGTQETTERTNGRDGLPSQKWGIYRGRDGVCGSHFSYTQERWLVPAYPRSSRDKQGDQASSIHTEGSKRCSFSGRRLELAGEPGFNAWLSAGGHEQEGQEILRSSMGGQDSRLYCAPFWAQHKPIYIGFPIQS